MAMLTLYTASTPNGYKVSVALEEMGLPYEVRTINLPAQEQKEPWFLKLNPNGRVPVIDDDGTVVFESGAILIYLAEKTGQLMPTSGPDRMRVIQWLMFQMGGIGPMMGQANVFYRYFPEKVQPAIDRYHAEVRRLFGVMDNHLEGREWLADAYSIADIANWCWIRASHWSGVDISPFPNLVRWRDAIAARPAAQRGTQVPDDALARQTDDDAGREAALKSRSIILTGKPSDES